MLVKVTPHIVKIVREETEPINEKEINVSKCIFEFSEEIEDDYVKEAYFTLNGNTYKQIIVNDECDYPHEVLEQKGELEIGVVVFKIENEEYEKLYNPTPDYYETWIGSLKEAENSEPITPSDKEQIEQAITNLQNNKQDILVSGENIKTLNNESLLGSGNIDIQVDLSNYYTKIETNTLLNGKQDTLTFDNEPTQGSTNPVTSTGIKGYVDNLVEYNTVTISSLTNNLENGSINASTGANQSSSSRIRTKIFFNVKQANLKLTIKSGYKVYIVGYSQANISSFDRAYNWFTSSDTELKTILSNYLRFVIAKTDNSSFTITDYTDDIFQFEYVDKNKLNDIDINNSIMEGVTFLAPYYNKFTRTSFITGTHTFDPATTRISCSELIKLGASETLYAKTGYEFNLIYFSNSSLSSYTSNTGWITQIDIPANQYFAISIKKTDTSNINTDESVNIYTKIEASSSNEEITPYTTQEANLISNVLSDKNSNTITFGVITDTHNSGNANYRTANHGFVADRLCEKAGVDFIIHLGDVIQGYGSSQAINKSYLNEYWQVQSNTYLPVLYAIGHHEMYGENGEGGYGSDSTAITRTDCVGICGLTNKYKNLQWSSDKASYYLDLTNNVRIIVLDSVSNTAKGFSNDVVSFLQTALIETEKKLIVFSHVPARKKVNYNNATVENGDSVETLLNNYSGTVLAYIHGHVHWDNIVKPTGISYPYYSVCCSLPIKVTISGHSCDEGTPVAYDRELNSYSEYCFDIFNIHTDTNVVKSFRFGAGNDRSYTP